jgi:hypothetical protein
MLQRRGNRLELYRHWTWGAFVDSGFDSGPQRLTVSGLPCATLHSLLCDKSSGRVRPNSVIVNSSQPCP